MRTVSHFIGGKAGRGGSARKGQVFNPNTGEVQAEVAFATAKAVDDAVQAAAKAAQPGRRPTRSAARG